MKHFLIFLFLTISGQAIAQDTAKAVSNIIQTEEVLNPYINPTELTFEQLVKDFGLVFLVLGILIFLIWLVNNILTKLRTRTINYLDKLVANSTNKSLSFINRPQLVTIVRNGTSIFRIIITLFLVYVSLPLLFYFFPWTKETATALIGDVLYPVKFILHSTINYIPNLLTIAIIFIITRFVVRSIKILAVAISTGKIKLHGFYPDWAFPTYNIFRALLYVFMFIIIFPYLPGSDSKVFQGVSVFLGVLFSLGSTSAISNIVAGVVLTYMRPFQIGDRVLVNNYLGDVTEKTLLVTRLRTVKNEYITIPNSIILGSQTINYTKSAEAESLILHTTVSIGYDADWKQVHSLLIEAAQKSKFVLKEKSPFVLQTSLDDFYVSYQLNVYVTTTNLPEIYSDLHKLIQDEFNKAGVEIMSPHYSSLRDGNNIAIPKDYVNDQHKSAGFKVDRS